VKRTCDVVIIGGGIQGLSLAYHLTCQGITDICLLEMNTLGSGSSGRSASVTIHSGTSESSLQLTKLSFDAYLRFQDELDADPGYDPIGMLFLCGAERLAELRYSYNVLRQHGVESYLVDRQGIADLTPGLNLEDIELGLYTPHDGVLDAHSIMMAYARHARRHGAEIDEGVTATGLAIQGDRAVGVHTTAGMIAAECVVNAAGFRAREVASWGGMDLPITNSKRHIFVTGPVPAYSDAFPCTTDLEAGWYIRREGPGVLIGMGLHESDEEDPQVDWSFLDDVVEHSIYRAPLLSEAGVITGWAGLRPLTPDGHPILGKVPHLTGYFNDCGWGGHGIMHAPVGGMILADLIHHGESSLMDARLFGADRFGGWLLDNPRTDRNRREQG
jgi:sarcosine oxidase subunit beta